MLINRILGGVLFAISIYYMMLLIKNNRNKL